MKVIDRLFEELSLRNQVLLRQLQRAYINLNLKSLLNNTITAFKKEKKREQENASKRLELFQILIPKAVITPNQTIGLAKYNDDLKIRLMQKEFKDIILNVFPQKTREAISEQLLEHLVEEAVEIGLLSIDFELFQMYPHLFCSQCGNCCKEPENIDLIYEDLSRFHHRFGNNFIEKYINENEMGFYFKYTMPCKFLDTKNKCTIYEVRPYFCRIFPYTGTPGSYMLQQNVVSKCDIYINIIILHIQLFIALFLGIPSDLMGLKLSNVIHIELENKPNSRINSITHSKKELRNFVKKRNPINVQYVKGNKNKEI